MSQPHRTVSVVDAGADPTGVTDSTAIINAAIPTPHMAKSLGAFNRIEINHETLN